MVELVPGLFIAYCLTRRAAGHLSRRNEGSRWNGRKRYPPAWHVSFTIILLLRFSPLKRAPHGAILTNGYRYISILFNIDIFDYLLFFLQLNWRRTLF